VIGRSRNDLHELLDTYHSTLVIVDGVTEAMTMHNLNPLDNVDVAKFNGQLIKPLTDSGAAVVSLDHVVKDRENRSRYALGGVHKLNVVTGAAYVLTNREPFGVGMTGRSTLAIAKDRPGQLRPFGVRSTGDLIWYGDLVLDSLGWDLAELSIEPAQARDDTFRPTKIMAAMTDLLAEKGPLAKRRILAGVSGKTSTKSDALDLLILDGYVSDKTPHELLKPYESDTK
jgi:hypothetical protein